MPRIPKGDVEGAGRKRGLALRKEVWATDRYIFQCIKQSQDIPARSRHLNKKGDQ